MAGFTLLALDKTEGRNEMRALLAVTAFICCVCVIGLPSHAASPQNSSPNTTYIVGPPLPAPPFGFEAWPEERRANWLLKSFDIEGLGREMAKWATGTQWKAAFDWATQTLRTPDAAPIVASIAGQLYELSAKNSHLSPTDVNEAMRRAAIYRLGALAMTLVDSRACADEAAAQESVLNSRIGAQQSLNWLKMATPNVRTSVLEYAVRIEQASWSQRHVYLTLCWNSRDALANLDESKQRVMGEVVRNGITVKQVYLPTRQGWLPPLRRNADQARSEVHDRLLLLLGKLIQ